MSDPFKFFGSNVNLLISLDVLLEEANVTRAAERLNISQPALSAQLNRLRALFNDDLLVPSERRRGMVLTPRANKLKQPLAEALRDLQAILTSNVQFDAATSSRHFSIATSDNALSMLGLDLVDRLQRGAGPGIRLSFRQPRPQLLAEELERGELDMVIGTKQLVPDRMNTQVLLQDRYIVAQRKKHPRGQHPITIDEYCSYPHILVSSSGGSLSGFVDDQLAELGRSRNVALSVQTYNAVPLFIARTDMLCMLPSLFLKRFESQLDVFEPPLPVRHFDLLVAWHPMYELDIAHRWLREELTKAASMLQAK